MRKPRDFDAELKALNDKARQLKERKLRQLGELVVATGADTLGTEHLAGLLIVGAESEDPDVREGWRKRGAAFFQTAPRPRRSTSPNLRGAQASDGGTASAERQDRAQ